MSGSQSVLPATTTARWSTRAIWRFGAFELDARSGELRRRGVAVSLQDQPFRVLLALLQRPGEVVSREELRCRLWPDGTHVDFEHGLNAAIRRLRVALGGDTGEGHVVETVPRRGYRFVGRAAAASPAPVAHPPIPIDSRIRARRRLAVLPFSAAGHVQEFFCEGLTEETTVRLACICPRHVAVVAKTTAKLISLAGEGGSGAAVDYVLEASVRSAAGRIRVVTRLIDVEADSHLWAETYEREIGDTLDAQADIADRIAQAVARALVDAGADLAAASAL
jgi:TolB-like protein